MKNKIQALDALDALERKLEAFSTLTEGMELIIKDGSSIDMQTLAYMADELTKSAITLHEATKLFKEQEHD